MKAIIFGTGESQKYYEGNDFKIGVNDIFDYRPVDIVCIMDRWDRLLEVRPGILKTTCPIVSARDINVDGFNIEYLQGVQLKELNFDKLPLATSQFSPFYACSVAIYKGYRDLRVFGVDLVNHPQGEKKGWFKNIIPRDRKDITAWRKENNYPYVIEDWIIMKEWLEERGGSLLFTEHSPIHKLINASSY